MNQNNRAIILALAVALALMAPIEAMAGSASLRIPTTWKTEADAGSGTLTSDSASAPGSNAIVDLIANGHDVWAATGRGVSHYDSTLEKWTTYGVEAGLGGEEIPALRIIKTSGQPASEVWAAASHSVVFENQSVPYGDGLFLSYDEGVSWEKVSPPEDQASGPFQICFDIAPFRGSMFAACFAGGLVMTSDQGQTWKNVFASNADRQDWENKLFLRLNNRFFSVVTDETVPDSAVVFAGSAEGVNKFVYLADKMKVTGHDIHALAQDGTRLFAATERGLSRTVTRGTTWRSFYESDGLATNYVGSVTGSGDTIWVGTDIQPDIAGGGTPGISDEGAGMAVSYDVGATWTVMQPEQTLGVGKRARSIVSAAGAWWVACGDGGLIRSGDLGQSWTNIFPNAALADDFAAHDPPHAKANRVNTLLETTRNDTTMLYAGTDSGVVVYVVLQDSLPGSAEIYPVGNVSPTGLGQQVIELALLESATDGPVLWSLNRAVAPNDERTSGYAVSLDSAKTWRVADGSVPATGVAFFNNQFYLSTDTAFYRGVYPVIDVDSLVTLSGFESLKNSGRIGTNFRGVVTEITLIDGAASLASLWVPTDSGLAVSIDGGVLWGVTFSNADPTEFDLIYRSAYQGRDSVNNFVSLSGNFVTALGLQGGTGGHPTVWAATQPTGTGQSSGISRSTDNGLNWTVPITGHRVWNFDFDGNHVWAASSEGLLHSPDRGETWDTLTQFVDPNPPHASIAEGTEIFAVAVVEDEGGGGEIWVGTENGFAILDRQNPDIVKSVRRTFPSVPDAVPSGEGGTYATPVPFSPNFHPNGVRFHYTPPVSGPVTITIWDFANRIVKTVTNGANREAGTDYHEADIWDGLNGNGDSVATGTYFYTIEYSNGDIHWGKLVVMP